MVKNRTKIHNQAKKTVIKLRRIDVSSFNERKTVLSYHHERHLIQPSCRSIPFHIYDHYFLHLSRMQLPMLSNFKEFKRPFSLYSSAFLIVFFFFFLSKSNGILHERLHIPFPYETHPIQE